jgi:hypothetical protein
MNRVRFCVMKLEYKYRINTKLTNRSNCVEAVVVVIIYMVVGFTSAYAVSAFHY